MENDNGLELSLGLSCGGSSAKSEGKNGGSLDIRPEDGERTSKIVADFKNFLNAVDQRQESGAGSQISTSDKPQENFFRHLSKNDADASTQSNGKGLWVPESCRSAESEDDRRRESDRIRSIPFDVNQKRLDRESSHSDLHEKSRTSHVSINTDGSTAENEDVAESEVETSTSKATGATDSNVQDLQAQKRFKRTSDSDLKMGNYAASFTVQPANPGKESSSVAGFATSGHSLPSMVQAVVHASSSEHLGMQPAVPGKSPSMFGYSSVQLPVLDRNNSLGKISHVQMLHPSYIGRGQPQPASMHAAAHSPSEPTQYDGRTSDQAKGDGKQHGAEKGSASQNGNDAKGGTTSFGANDTSDRSTAECISFDFPAIKPGFAADLKFGGSGSCPNLPWVSTSGPGPNGRTISGVTYRYSTSQIKIVCACHGSHMSPEDFIRHASEEQDGNDAGRPKNNAVTSA